MSTNAKSAVDPFRHPLLAVAGCPASANGAPIYLQQLIRAMEACQDLGMGASAKDWLNIVRSLSKSVGKDVRNPSLSPTAAELKDQPWGSLHGCIDARAHVRNQSTKQVDALLGQLVLMTASEQRQLTETALHGFRTCYVALSGRRKIHAEWSLLATLELNDQSAITTLLPALTHPPVRAFAALVLSILKQPMPTPEGISESGEEHESRKPEISDRINFIEQQQESETANSATETPDLIAAKTEITQSNFKRGDSVIGWHLRRSSNANRNDKLALGSWNALPPEQTRLIAAGLPRLISNIDSPWHHAAVVALSSLLTSTPPHVLLHSNVNREGDLNIDLVGKQFNWSMEILRGTSAKATQSGHTKINIPFPDSLAEAIDELARNKDVAGLQCFSDLFGISPDTAAWDVLLRRIHDLLRELSEPAIQAFPGRWANSVSRVYIKVLGSDLLSSVCSLDLALVPQAALYYFHPSERDIRDSVQKLYEYLGLGRVATSSAVSNERKVVSDTQLRTGFNLMEKRAAALSTEILTKRTTLAASVLALNELIRLTAAMSIFLVGGRGSKVEEITCGALFCSSNEWWLEDKKVEHENSSRIVPKVRHQQHWLHRLFEAQQAVAERLSRYLRRDRSQRWKELASGYMRFDAIAFEYLTLESDKVNRSPLTAGEIEIISQHYFSAGKNFMRHVLITCWGTSRKDGNLLRLITGHSAAGLAVPAAGAIYTAKCAVQAAGTALENVLEPLLPTIDANPKDRLGYRFIALPGRRILKVQSAHREHVDTWAATVFSRWHLAAQRIMLRIRELLLLGKGPSQLFARLWLNLIAFDAVHEANDLEALFIDINSSIELSETGWVMKVNRPGSSHLLVTPVQIPTALLLSELHEKEYELPSYAAIVDAADQWLKETTPEFWGTKKKGAAEALIASCRLWCDWCLPAAVQLCYPQASHAPVLDSASNCHLFGLNAPKVAEPRQYKQTRHHTNTDLFSTFFKVINRLGSTRHKHGEQKKRAQLFSRWVTWTKLPERGELACTLIQVVSVNSSRIRVGKRNAIEWSSQATYLSSLRPFLTLMRSEDPDNFDALDWHNFSTELINYSRSEEKQNVTANEATHWILGCLRELGYPIPHDHELTHNKRYPTSTLTTAIAHITEEQVHAAIQHATSDAKTPLECARVQAAFYTLSNLPLRWGELAAIGINDIASVGKLCITSSGYAHLKSHSSRRQLELSPELFGELQLLIQQIDTLNTHGRGETTIFGSKHLIDGTVTQDSAWIGDAITWAMQIVCNNTNFRIHAFRANFVTNTLLPSWHQAITTALRDGIGPKEATSFFSYNESRAWLTELVRIACGHASIRTTLSYYFHGWLLVRSIALHATLANHEPTAYLLEKVGVSTAALMKARSRTASIQADPWKYLQHKLPKKIRFNDNVYQTKTPDENRQFHTKHIGIIFEEHSKPQKGFKESPSSNEHPATQLLAIRYLSLRMLGKDETSTGNLLDTLPNSTTTQLEAKLKFSKVSTQVLRGRVKGEISGRALKADVNLLISPQADECIRALSRMSVDTLHALLDLLLTKPKSINWSEELAAIAPSIIDSNFCLELVADIKHVDPEINVRLSTFKSILIGSPAHDVGALPRVFVLPKDVKQRHMVAKARWTTLVRVLSNALIVLRSPEI